MAPLLLGVVLALPGVVPVVRGEEELERAAKLLQDNEEKECRDGTELCVTEDSVAAVELLLDVLRQEADRGLAVAHYRDVVWDGLRRIKAADARARVRQELEKNKKSELVRQWCAELLGEYGDPAFTECLIPVLGDKDLEVRRAAARALGRLRFGERSAGGDGGGLDVQTLARLGVAIDGLEKLYKDKDPILRANAIESSARIDPANLKPVLIQGLKDKDAGVRCALLGTVGALYPDEAEALAVAALADKDWRPRMQAVDILAGLDSKTAVPRLIAAVGDARPAVAARATRNLQERTGLKHTRKEAWEAWWAENGDGFDPAARAKKEQHDRESTSATFSGIELASDHVAFLIDKSQTMGETLSSQQCTKDEAARKELEATFSRLQGRLAFSLFTYADHVTSFDEKGAVELGPKSQAKALAFVDDEDVSGKKNIWQALEAALADPDIDTVFLLSSGEPEIGLYVHWNRVTWHLKELNRFRKVVVHAIAYSDSQWYRDQLEKIAAATGGEFKYFE